MNYNKRFIRLINSLVRQTKCGTDQSLFSRLAKIVSAIILGASLFLFISLFVKNHSQQIEAKRDVFLKYSSKVSNGLSLRFFTNHQIDDSETVTNAFADNTHKEFSDIQKYLKIQAQDFYSNKSLNEWEEYDKELQKKIISLNENQLSILSNSATSSEEPIEVRALAVYILVKVGKRADSNLLKIFVSPINERQLKNEYSIRSMALEGIEQHQNFSQLTNVNTVKDEYLKRLLTIVKEGERIGKPLLHNYIEHINNNARTGEYQ